MLLTVEQCKELVEFLQRQMETDIMAYMPENLENGCHNMHCSRWMFVRGIR